MKKKFVFFISFMIYMTLFIIEDSFSRRKYFEYNVYNYAIGEENYKTTIGQMSLTLGSSEIIYAKGIFELSMFFDLSYFVFYEVKSLKAIENEIEKLAKSIKPKINSKKSQITEKIRELQLSYDLAISQSNQPPVSGSSAFELHGQIEGLYNDLITVSNYEENLNNQLQSSNTNYSNTIKSFESQKASIKGVIDTVGSLDQVAKDTLSTSNSPKAQKVSSFLGSSKFQAAKEIATNTAKIATDIAFEIKSLNEKSKLLETQSKIEQQKSIVYLEETSLISQIEALESLNTKDIDNASHIEQLQSLYAKYDKIRSVKLTLNRDSEISDKYIRVPIVTGLFAHFTILKFIVPYVEVGFITSIDNSIYRSLAKINFGVRLGAGINFEFFQKKFIVGVHFKYWGIAKHFISISPTIGIRI